MTDDCFANVTEQVQPSVLAKSQPAPEMRSSAVRHISHSRDARASPSQCLLLNPSHTTNPEHSSLKSLDQQEQHEIYLTVLRIISCEVQATHEARTPGNSVDENIFGGAFVRYDVHQPIGISICWPSAFGCEYKGRCLLENLPPNLAIVVVRWIEASEGETRHCATLPETGPS